MSGCSLAGWLVGWYKMGDTRTCFYLWWKDSVEEKLKRDSVEEKLKRWENKRNE